RRGRVAIIVVMGLDGFADSHRRKLRRDLGVGIGQKRRGPILVGDAEPDIGGVEEYLLLLLDIGVGLFLQALVAEYPDQPFVQDVVAERLRRSMARDQPEGIERDRRRAVVDDLILDGEE